MKNMRIIFTILWIFCGFTVFSISKKNIMDYIQLYKSVAVHEMHMNGVPASIKMAQAILESNAGTSDLALQANNHFGIKCGGIWNGPTYYKKDDDRDRKGRLIPSCFRVFESAKFSYQAHSLFLLDPQKIQRYGSLFELEQTDYKSWAWGLKKAGYATNPAYANLLINIIETYSLYTFDYYEDSKVKYIQPENLIAQPRNIRSHEVLDRNHEKLIVKRPGEAAQRPVVEQQIMINKREALVTRKGQTMEQLAGKYDLPVDDMVKYNDLDLEGDDYLAEGMVVFIEKKKRWYRGNEKHHIVKEGESLRSISQKYGIRLSTLARKNRINSDDIPIPGERIVLRGSKARGDNIPLTYDDVDIVESAHVSEPVLKHQWEINQQNLVSENRELTQMPVLDVKENTSEMPFDLNRAEVATDDSEPQAQSTQKTLPSPVETYTVGKGDTLYSISRRFGITISSIMETNEMQSDQLKIGQTLKIIR